MKLKIFALRDQKIDQFMTPMAMQTPGQIVRMLQDEMTKDTTHILAQHGEDFELFELGEFDTDSGQLTGHAPKSVILISDLNSKA